MGTNNDMVGIYSTVEFVVDKLCESYARDYCGTKEPTWKRELSGRRSIIVRKGEAISANRYDETAK